MANEALAARFCRVVAESPKISNATARIGAWLIGAAMRTGGFPIELTLRQIENGFTRNGVSVEGTGSRFETIKASLNWLQEQGYLRVEDGRPIQAGYRSRVYTLEL